MESIFISSDESSSNIDSNNTISDSNKSSTSYEPAVFCEVPAVVIPCRIRESFKVAVLQAGGAGTVKIQQVQVVGDS